MLYWEKVSSEPSHRKLLPIVPFPTPFRKVLGRFMQHFPFANAISPPLYCATLEWREGIKSLFYWNKKNVFELNFYFRIFALTLQIPKSI